MNKIIIFILGFILSVIGFMYIIIYLNLLTMGYTFIEYIKFIITRYECIMGIIGLIIVSVIIIYKR